MARRWIQAALGVKRRRVGKGKGHRKAVRKVAKHRGALHRMLGIPMGQKIPWKLLQKHKHAPGKLGLRVRFAITMRKRAWRKRRAKVNVGW